MASPATSLDIARVLDTPLAVLILNEYLTTVGAKSSLDFWKAGRKFMLTYRGRPEAMLKKAKKVYDEHLAGKEVLYLKAATVEAIKDIVEGDGSEVSAHMFRQAMKETQEFMATFADKIEASSFWPRMSSALSDTSALTKVRSATQRARALLTATKALPKPPAQRTAKLPPPPVPAPARAAAAAPAPAPGADAEAAAAEAAAAEAAAAEAAAAEAAAAEAAAAEAAAAEAAAAEAAAAEAAAAEAAAAEAAAAEAAAAEAAAAEAAAAEAAAAEAAAAKAAAAAAAKPKPAPAGPSMPRGPPPLPSKPLPLKPKLCSGGALQLVGEDLKGQVRYFPVARSSTRNGKFTRHVVQIDFATELVQVLEGSWAKVTHKFHELAPLAEVRERDADFIREFTVPQRRYLVTLGTADAVDTVVAASPEEANVMRGMLVYARANATAAASGDAASGEGGADGETGAGAGAGAGAATASGLTASLGPEALSASALGPALVAMDSAPQGVVGDPDAVVCDKLDFKGKLMYSSFFVIVMDAHMYVLPSKSEAAARAFVEYEVARRKRRLGTAGAAEGDAAEVVPMPTPNDVVYLAGMKAVRQGTVNISLEATADGLWPALKAKVARVLHDRAAATVTDDEEKQEFPRDMRFASCVEETFQLRGANSTVTDTMVKALRSACRMHAPDVVYPPYKDVTQLWWAVGDNGVPAVINSAIARIENEFIDELGLYRKPGDSKAVNKILTRFGWEGRTPVFLDTDVHVLTNMIKRFFINLSEPILTYSLFHSFMDAAEATDPDSEQVWTLVNSLPHGHVPVLQRLMGHLRRVSNRQEINKLSREALAMAFGAVIVRHRDPAEIRSNIQRLPTVVMKLMCLNWAKGSGVL